MSTVSQGDITDSKSDFSLVNHLWTRKNYKGTIKNSLS